MNFEEEKKKKGEKNVFSFSKITRKIFLSIRSPDFSSDDANHFLVGSRP